MRIAIDEIVDIGLDAHALEADAEIVGGMLAVVMGDDDAAHHEATGDELAAKAEDILVVGDAEVSTHLVLNYVLSTDDDDDFNLVADFAEHAQFAVRLETGEHAAGVVVVEEFATEFEVEFALELLDAFLDVL